MKREVNFEAKKTLKIRTDEKNFRNAKLKTSEAWRKSFVFIKFSVKQRKKRKLHIMNPGLIHDNAFDYVYSLVVDILIFLIKSMYFLAETVFLTILPNRLRKMKVSGDCCECELLLKYRKRKLRNFWVQRAVQILRNVQMHFRSYVTPCVVVRAMLRRDFMWNAIGNE